MIFLAAAGFLLAAFGVSLCVGRYPLSLADIAAAIAGREGMSAQVFWRLRLPRSLAVAASGMAMGVSGVVYQRNAFTCVNNGSINNTPDNSCIRAALDALNGWDPTGGCLYYYNPKTAVDDWIRTRPTKTVIGRHNFCT